MEQRHKQRLVGAIVLIALAVIFLPMILRGPVEDRTLSVPAQIPPRPDAPLSGEPVQPPPAAEAPALDRVPLQAPAVAEPDEEPPPDTAMQEPDAVSEGAGTPGAVDPDSRAASVEGFAVQVGSFSRRDNAMALRDRLRERGYSAFVDEVRRDAGALYRLRVGPVMDRDEARELAQRLQRDEELEGLVVSHP
ncbi:MAG: SPOR domain-containing protein [Ectothiorhodospiraceae bacterium]|nr:SPOR domain-containing protein [Ectothiorhodospiraceae bacterium]